LNRGWGEPTPRQRCAAKKLKLVLESKTISEGALGDWLRRNGMHSEHLAVRERELEDIVRDKQAEPKQENAELKKRNRSPESNLLAYSAWCRPGSTACPVARFFNQTRSPV
jgi:hypothetical protein